MAREKEEVVSFPGCSKAVRKEPGNEAREKEAVVSFPGYSKAVRKSLGMWLGLGTRLAR